MKLTFVPVDFQVRDLMKDLPARLSGPKIAKKVVLGKMAKKIAHKADKRMAKFSYMVFGLSLCGLLLLGMPLAAALRGIALSLVRRQPKWVPYYLCYAFFNYTAMLRELLGGRARGRRRVAQAHAT